MNPKIYAVEVEDSGQVVWVGVANSPLNACTVAAREGNPNVGPFVQLGIPGANDFSLNHLVLNTYDVSDLGELATLEHFQNNGETVDTDNYTGTFYARYCVLPAN